MIRRVLLILPAAAGAYLTCRALVADRRVLYDLFGMATVLAVITAGRP